MNLLITEEVCGFYRMRHVKNIMRLIKWNTICNVSCIFHTNSNQCPFKLTSRKVSWREIRSVGWLWQQWILAWFQASATKYMRTALFWVITRWGVVIPYQHFGTTYRSLIQGSRIQKESWLSQYGVDIRKSVGNDKFSVAWCQPVGLMQVVGRGGDVVVSAALKRDNLWGKKF